MKKAFFLFFSLMNFLYASSSNSGSVLLMNDSPFILTATILAADGSYLGEVTIQPGQQTNFTQSLNSTYYKHPGFPNVSYTPFTVIWQCSSEGYYSVCTQVSPGSFVKAGDCPGNHFCKPKQKKEKDKHSTLEKKK